MVALERGDDARRVADRAAVEKQDRQRGCPRPERRRGRYVAPERAADVRDPLLVERPAHLLVEVRNRQVPEDGRVTALAHISLHHMPPGSVPCHHPSCSHCGLSQPGPSMSSPTITAPAAGVLKSPKLFGAAAFAL